VDAERIRANAIVAYPPLAHLAWKWDEPLHRMHAMIPKRCRTTLLATVVVSASGCIDFDFVRKLRGSPGPPATLEIVSGAEQNGIAGTTLPSALGVRLVDAGGRPVAGRPITFRVVQGNGSLVTESVLTDANGRAATLWTLGPVAGEPQSVRALLVVPETGVGLTADFRAESVAGEPATVRERRGNRQMAEPGARLRELLEVEVSDRFDNPVPGVPIGWRVAAGGGTVEPVEAVTNASGIAHAWWTVGPGPVVDQRTVRPGPGLEQRVHAGGAGLAPVVFQASLVTVYTVLAEDFESDLGLWTGKHGGAHSGSIVADPINATNRVVTFRRSATAGDMFSVEIRVDRDAEYELSFDYLGLPLLGSGSSNHGGFIGISEELPGRHAWIAGTDPAHTRNDIVDDGTWHSYSFRFRISEYVRAPGGAVRVMLEDADMPGRRPGVVGDVFFDNVRLRRITP
jgi:hypothetical protein